MRHDPPVGSWVVRARTDSQYSAGRIVRRPFGAVQVWLEPKPDTARKYFVNDLVERLMLDLRPFVHHHQGIIEVAVGLGADHALRPSDEMQRVLPVDHHALLRM